jgi:undecaprenyl phosphate-alpha-L-ara4N flippase subunit ArnE
MEAMITLAWSSLALVVLLGTAGQVALKHGIDPARSSQRPLLLRPLILIWLACYAASTILWLIALRAIPLSQAFPILGMQFALIPLASSRLLGERVYARQWAGILLIAGGVALVGHG